MTRPQVAGRIRDAWDTLRRVPAHGVPGFKSTWPPVVQDAMDAYGYTAETLRLGPAAPVMIDRMHETFGWFVYLEDRQHLTRAVWFTCGRGMGTYRAGMILGLHRNTVARYRDEALDRMAEGVRIANFNHDDLAKVRKLRESAFQSLNSGNLRTRL